MRRRRLLKDHVALNTIMALIVAWIAAFPIGVAFAQDPLEADVEVGATCDLPRGLNALSGCIGKDRNVVIGPKVGECTRVFVDGSYTGANALGTIRIEDKGFLFVPDQTLEIETKGIDVVGLFQVGTKDCPIGTANPKNTVTIRFTGGRTSDSEDHTKGIVVHDSGMLRLFGARGVPGGTPDGISWTHLKEAAGPPDKYGADTDKVKLNIGRPVPTGGDKVIQLAKDVSTGAGAWQSGDWIVVATTSFSPFETEFVQIDTLKSDGKGGSTVTLKQALKHYHFGGPDPGSPSSANFNAGADLNYGIDERAEVGLISRNVKLTAKIESGDKNVHWGGEIRILPGFAEVSIQGVEIEKFGKDQIGSYPIHFHRDDDVGATPPLVNANSVHHSYNKCVTIHSTQNMTVRNMVCARIVGHIFYQEVGNESGIKYLNNLGLGAMSHYFDIAAGTPEERKAQFWGGDYLANTAGFGYNGFNVPNTDAQDNPTRGACTTTLSTGELTLAQPNHTPFADGLTGKECPSGTTYNEPASGFWIIHPGTVLEGNSIGGCQGVGRGYWYVPPKNHPSVPENLRSFAHIKIGSFKNNRVHGCYSGVYAEEEFGVFSFQLFPTTNQKDDGKNLITTFDGLTATRIRDRGIWIRPVWSVLTNGRFATNKASVILVSSGGLDGNAPGVWALLEKSVLVGMSTNNVDRWGPCPVKDSAKGVGCVDLTTAANDWVADGYPLPAFTMFGYQIYDGPVRIFNNRFVNFNRDVTPHLTVADQTFLSSYTGYFQGFPPVAKTRYEGDAALGWFKVNQSAYPNATISKNLTFTNVDLRHQVFTQEVNFGDFQDGDRNTVIIDGDGTLSGFEVVTSADNKKVVGADPVSLNNLGFNHAGNSVDECLAEGQQDTDTEGRPTALITPLGVATLEFGAAFPPPRPNTPPALPATKQLLTFTKDYKEFCLDTAHPELCQHQSMPLTSRNGLGLWEPKVVSGYGYTVAASKCANPPQCTEGDAGIPARVSVGLTDAVKPVISADDPFFVRLGICYTNTDGAHPAAGNFTITRGYHSWGGAGTNFNDLDVRKFFNKLNRLYPKTNGEICENKDIDTCESPTECKNLDPERGCPAHGIILKGSSACPSGTTQDTDRDAQTVCVYPKSNLTAAASISDLTKDGKPVLDKFFYDSATGMLFFNVVQDSPNAFGPSPLGDCKEDGTGDASCPKILEGESYYACPPQGCIDYVVRLNDANYKPGPSKCTPYPTYETPEPKPEFKLVYKGTTTAVEFVQKNGKDNKFPHYEAKTAPTCPITTTP